jgi:hypothetical protein
MLKVVNKAALQIFEVVSGKCNIIGICASENYEWIWK